MSQKVEAGWVERRLEEGEAVVVNLLDQERFEAAHVPGSVNVPIDSWDFAERIHDLAPDLRRPVVVYGAVADSSTARAASRLEAMGYIRVYEFRSGMEAWRRTGHRVERGRQLTVS